MSDIVSIDKMGVGRKKGGKNWTKKEIEARKKAAEKFKRESKSKLEAPAWLSDDALEVWEKTLKGIEGFDILDMVDVDMLAAYCDTYARYVDVNKMINQEGYTVESSKGQLQPNPKVQVAQGYLRLIQSYAEKLGLTPNARARLAKKMADEEIDPTADLFN